MFWGEIMKTIISTVGLLFFFGCQDFNTDSGDAAFDGVSSSESVQFSAALTVISSNCISCHPGWSEYQTSQAYIDAGLIIAGDASADASGSRLMCSLANFNSWGDCGINSPMPNSIGLTNDEVTTLQDWINGLN